MREMVSVTETVSCIEVTAPTYSVRDSEQQPGGRGLVDLFVLIVYMLLLTVSEIQSSSQEEEG